jgi:hypothetical protein
MAKRQKVGLGEFALVDDGVGGFDFVITGFKPFVDDPAGATDVEKKVKEPDWFDFSKVTAGQAYAKDSGCPRIGFLTGRKVLGTAQISAVVTSIINEVKSQAGIV